MVGLSGMTWGGGLGKGGLGMDVKVSASGDGRFGRVVSDVVHKLVETLDAK